MYGRALVTASAGLGLVIWWSTHDINLGPAAAMWAGVDMIRFNGGALEFGGQIGPAIGLSDFAIELFAFTGMNFPANTTGRFLVTWNWERA
jgi:hypothetical protein